MTQRMSTTRRQALSFALGACASSFASRSSGAEQTRPAVLELFTSQGCSSCPPADAFMEELAGMDGVIALTFNVDYWDYLGWRDTLGSPAHSQRQYDYAKARGDMDVYTPQMIVNGSSHYVGSSRNAVFAAVKRSWAGTPSVWVPLRANMHGEEVVIDIAAAPKPTPDATLWLMAVAARTLVKIEKGENAGRDMTYFNVVRSLVPAGMWHGKAVSLALPAKGIMKEGCGSCVALLQSGNVGPVIGAARWSESSG